MVGGPRADHVKRRTPLVPLVVRRKPCSCRSRVRPSVKAATARLELQLCGRRHPTPRCEWQLLWGRRGGGRREGRQRGTERTGEEILDGVPERGLLHHSRQPCLSESTRSTRGSASRVTCSPPIAGCQFETKCRPVDSIALSLPVSLSRGLRSGQQVFRELPHMRRSVSVRLSSQLRETHRMTNACSPRPTRRLRPLTSPLMRALLSRKAKAQTNAWIKDSKSALERADSPSAVIALIASDVRMRSVRRRLRERERESRCGVAASLRCSS